MPFWGDSHRICGGPPFSPLLAGGTKGGYEGTHITLLFEEILKPIEQVRVFRNTKADENHKDDDDPN